MNHRSPRPEADRTVARQSTLRESNLALVIRTCLTAAQPISRAGVAAATGMTRATAARLVDELIAAGVLAESQPTAAGGRGRPGMSIIAGRGFAALGLEVNGTCLAARVIALSGEILAERIEGGDFRASEPAPVLARLGAIAEALLAGTHGGTHLVGVGLALPGLVSTESGRLLIAPNLGWSNVEPRRYLALEIPAGLPISIGNEADYAARATAELAPGRPEELRDFIYLSGETGIGGAVVRDGVVMRGRHGWAGEIGHVTVDPGGPVCRCGSTGCLELYAGRHALLAAADLPETGAVDLTARALDGDPAVIRALERAAWALGVALAVVINIVDIPVIVLGGHLGELSEFLIPLMKGHLQDRMLSSHWVAPEIRAGSPDPVPGATGAAYVELGELIDNPARWIG
ncbi:ROK family protein [Nocardia acidivorans]|uniref:ROK family protein n=1 Tax=Nocardia acidivorans TaxID=404580 RepID=UPI00082D4557|nr:ROK family protein [Nocardia acidivorans]